MPQTTNLPAKHLRAGDRIGGRVVESTRFISGAVLVFYRDGGQATFLLDTSITVLR